MSVLTNSTEPSYRQAKHPTFRSLPLAPRHLPNCTSPTNKERDWRRPNQSAQTPEVDPPKIRKIPQTNRAHFKTRCPLFDNLVQSCYLDFCMFSLGHLRFLLCSRDLDVLHAQRIIGFFKSELPTNQRGRKIRSRGTHGQYRGLSPVLRERDIAKAQKEVTHTLPLSESLRKVIKDKSRLLFIKLQENTYKIKTCTPSPPIRPTYTLQN